jgi:agmatine/peptidylarginine deiminase
LLVNVVHQVRGRLDIVLLVSNIETCEAAKRLLRESSIPLKYVRFVELPHDTMWARDYGPIVVKTKEGRPVVIDAVYSLDRANDDRVPEGLARLLNVRVVQMPLRIDGGNLLSNGDGLAITTNYLFDENQFGELDEEVLRDVLRENYGLSRIAVLEPLLGEPTGHVDMFATFTSANTVVVGQYDPKVDPANAAILDRNANQLSRLRTKKGPLRVVRIPMPPHDDNGWRTYTNVIYANGVLLVPTYGELDASTRTEAMITYKKLLPGWRVVAVDSSRLIESNGALHCISMNLGPLGRLPEFPPPRRHEAEQIEPIHEEIALMLQKHDHFLRILFRSVTGDTMDLWSPPLLRSALRAPLPSYDPARDFRDTTGRPVRLADPSPNALRLATHHSGRIHSARTWQRTEPGINLLGVDPDDLESPGIKIPGNQAHRIEPWRPGSGTESSDANNPLSHLRPTKTRTIRDSRLSGKRD